jgi:hypothetical protein
MLAARALALLPRRALRSPCRARAMSAAAVPPPQGGAAPAAAPAKAKKGAFTAEALYVYPPDVLEPPVRSCPRARWLLVS